MQNPEKVSQFAFYDLISDNTKDLPLVRLLKQAGFSTVLEDLHIELDAKQHIDFSSCEFNNVTFSGDFSHSSFVNVKMNNSIFQDANLESICFAQADLNKVSFENSKISKAIFYDSEITQASFTDIDLRDSKFIRSHLNATNVWDSYLSDLYFADSKFENTLFAKSDFSVLQNDNSEINNIHVIFTQPYEAESYFPGTNVHWIRPTILTMGDQEWHDAPYGVAQRYGAIVDTVPEYINDDMFNNQLSMEVNQELSKIHREGLQGQSIGQQILYSEQPAIKSIKEKGWHYMENVDAILLPGGPDVHPEFYGEMNTHSWTSSSYYREILEFSLIDAAIAMDKPILGICHGSQVVNVYLGGTLYQDVPGQFGIKPVLDIHTREGILGSVLEDSVCAPSYHHQAVKDVAPSLEVVASYNGIIKATQANDDKKIMLTQFHPEDEVDQSSKNILSSFIELSAEPITRDKFISLSDVLSIGNHEARTGDLSPTFRSLPQSTEIISVEDHSLVFG